MGRYQALQALHADALRFRTLGKSNENVAKVLQNALYEKAYPDETANFREILNIQDSEKKAAALAAFEEKTSKYPSVETLASREDLQPSGSKWLSLTTEALTGEETSRLLIQLARAFKNPEIGNMDPYLFLRSGYPNQIETKLSLDPRYYQAIATQNRNHGIFKLAQSSESMTEFNERLESLIDEGNLPNELRLQLNQLKGLQNPAQIITYLDTSQRASQNILEMGKLKYNTVMNWVKRLTDLK